MKPVIFVGIGLILLGIVALSYNRIPIPAKKRLSISVRCKLPPKKKNRFLCRLC